MDLWSVIVRFFQGGGDFMYPIALVFVVGLSIAIERYIYLTHTAVRNRSLWNEVVPMLAQGNFRQVVQVTSKSDSAIGHILNYGLARIQSARRRDDIEKAMEESLMEVVPRLEKRTHYLATCADQTHHGAQQAEQGCEVGEGCQVVRALLQARHDLHQAFLHRLLDVIAAAGGLNARQAVVENVPDRRIRLRRYLHDLAEVALRKHGDDFVPETAITHGRVRQVDVPLDGDREAHHEHDGNGVHEVPATLEKPNDHGPQIHRNHTRSVQSHTRPSSMSRRAAPRRSRQTE